MLFPLPQPVFLLLVALPFVYFYLAGSSIFQRSFGDELGALVAEMSLFVGGPVGTWLAGFRTPIWLWNGIAALALMLCAILLYEWARRTIRERRFYIAWSGETPQALCDRGPYARIRHPLYASYILAFLAVLAAIPKTATFVLFLINAALFTHAAISDERSLSQSPIADDYARYRKRAGMFMPRLFGRRA